ncbi:MAG: type II secretion system protein [Patescibacteria group bacterium]
MTKNSQKGFTLIELLVVIAIIGILSTVVLASLSSARNKSSDAKIISQIRDIRSKADLYTGTNGVGNPFPVAPSLGVPTTCADTSGTMFSSANNGVFELFSSITLSDTVCVSDSGLPFNGTKWAVAAKLSTGFWCVDSKNVSRNKTSGGVPYSDLKGTSPAAITGGNYSCN